MPFLRGEAPDTTDETAAEEATTLRGLAWSTLVASAFTATLADPTPAEGEHRPGSDVSDPCDADPLFGA